MYFALTGSIACGKTTFARCLATLGVEIQDADDIVHALQGPGGRAVEPIRAAFGEEAIDAHGAVARAWLAHRVFGEEEALRTLNAIVHPLVREALRSWRERGGDGGLGAAVVPLLFEVGWEGDWACVVCVTAPLSDQAARLRERGLNDEAIRHRVAAQWSQAEKAERADYVVRNDGTMEELMMKAEALLKTILESAR